MIEAKFIVERNDFKLTVDFQMPEKGVTALFGQSGSGKTTTINAICGLVKPDLGTIRINGHTLFETLPDSEVMSFSDRPIDHNKIFHDGGKRKN